MNAFESCFAALCRCRETTWPRCTSAQRNIQRLLSSWEWWIDGRVTIAFRINKNPDHETHHDCLSVPYTTASMCHLFVRLVTSWPKRTLAKWKQRLVEFVPFWLLFYWATSLSVMDLLLFGCQLSNSVNWKIWVSKMFTPRFTLYLLNKCRLQSPQSLWSISCINNVIDLLFEPLSL